MVKGKKWAALVALLTALALVAAACGDDGDDNSDGTTGGNAGTTGEGDLSGSIVISGSSTVLPISSLVAEVFNETNPDVSISVDGPGTGDGFELFCNGETDISDASRPIDEEEVAACEGNGIGYTELEVGIDGIAVMTSPDNDAISCLNFGDLYSLVGPESEGFGSWSDANALAADAGGTGSFPDLPLVITAPGEESGTYDSFIEIALEGIAEERAQEATTRKDYQSSADDNVIIQGIAGAEGSFGWVGFAYYVENSSSVKAIQIDGGSGCVEPTVETIADGSYPISRSLYIYVNNAKAAENPALRAFVDFYTTEDVLGGLVSEVGYVSLPSERVSATQEAWAGAAV
jgi:phosphate transport system substrate-binding protein